MTKLKRHYNIYGAEESKYGIALCGIFPEKENLTSITGYVTCKNCIRLIQSKNYSVSQFVKKGSQNG